MTPPTTSLAMPFMDWVGQLAKTHTDALARHARAQGLSAQDALDAVQEAFHTFLSLPQARSLVDHDEDAQRLLYVIVRNAARNMRRRHFRTAPHEPVDDALALDAELPSADELIERAQEHVQLLGCIAKLNQVQRHVVTLRMLDELQSSQIAQELELSPNHVSVLLYRARHELMRCITA